MDVVCYVCGRPPHSCACIPRCFWCMQHKPNCACQQFAAPTVCFYCQSLGGCNCTEMEFCCIYCDADTNVCRGRCPKLTDLRKKVTDKMAPFVAKYHNLWGQACGLAVLVLQVLCNPQVINRAKFALIEQYKQIAEQLINQCIALREFVCAEFAKYWIPDHKNHAGAIAWLRTELSVLTNCYNTVCQGFNMQSQQLFNVGVNAFIALVQKWVNQAQSSRSSQ